MVVGGLSAVAAGLVSLGIPKQSAIKYEAEIKADKFVLVVHSTAEEAERAQLLPWTSSEKTHYVRVIPEMVTGRRFRFGPPLLGNRDRA